MGMNFKGGLDVNISSQIIESLVIQIEFESSMFKSPILNVNELWGDLDKKFTLNCLIFYGNCLLLKLSF